mmetsp:Transcript_33902/g.97478  ORF Transcript_33902/g.97478 Transcript_33902/m.97478 type:complete len:341 (+) Transcript_33902:389-1411(+)
MAATVYRDHGTLEWPSSGHDEVPRRHHVGFVEPLHSGLKIRGGLHYAAGRELEALAVPQKAIQHALAHAVKAGVLLEAPAPKAHRRREADEAWPMGARNKRLAPFHKKDVHGDVWPVECFAVCFHLEACVVQVSAMDHCAILHCCKDAGTPHGLQRFLRQVRSQHPGGLPQDFQRAFNRTCQLVTHVQKHETLHAYIRMADVCHDALELAAVVIRNGHQGGKHFKDGKFHPCHGATFGKDAKGLEVLRYVLPAALWSSIEVHHKFWHCKTLLWASWALGRDFVHQGRRQARQTLSGSRRGNAGAATHLQQAQLVVHVRIVVRCQSAQGSRLCGKQPREQD